MTRSCRDWEKALYKRIRAEGQSQPRPDLAFAEASLVAWPDGHLRSRQRSELTRRVAQNPFSPLPTKVFGNVEGTLAGFRTPTYAQGIGVAGFHLHFLQKDKQAGGHALDYRLRAGKVQVCTVHDLQIELPTSGDFLKTNFEDLALNQKIKAAEG